ncbi:MAG: ERAP1-like C-terminal domain-containing protein [Planctomycetes bacterium]|nr:ERAP1-like C-terminal domain-containing protein [Planctomycetota bacterium]
MRPSESTNPSPGITHQLAVERAARIHDVHYRLSFKLGKKMAAVAGSCRTTFELNARGQVVLDFAGEELTGLTVNGARVEPRRVANHIVLPAAQMRIGTNEVRADFSSKVAPTGTPLTVYHDATDGADYYYSLIVPADAHRLFPCFDQPDLKGVFELTVETPAEWKVVANGKELRSSTATVRSFAPTKPLPTYLFAFAAGPFAEIGGHSFQPAGRPPIPMRMFLRQSKADRAEVDHLFDMHGRAATWLGDYFAYPYPFAKLDMVLLPGFPYGGMEHAGAIFYRESSLVFEQQPTEGELTRRSTLIYHEVSHQWFGNLVTMRWFDDLWLKEGFATFMGFTLFETLEPGKHAWLRFHHRVKPAAYRVDGTPGTTPVYQQLANLADAKSAYGAIVYNKAPAILRELNHRLGPAAFQSGLQLFLRQHEFGNATWRELVSALETAAKQSARHWSSRWILAAGMPRVEAQWRVEASRMTEFAIHQQSVQGDEGTWPLQLEVLLIDASGSFERVRVVADSAVTRVPSLIGRVAPACVLLNPRDIAYGQFLLDDRSRDWLVDHAQNIEDPLVRAVAMSALFDTVRETKLDPARFATTALRLLAGESDAGTHAWLLGALRVCLLRYMSGTRSEPLLQKLTEILLTQLEGSAADLKTQVLRFLLAYTHGPQATSLCQRVVANQAPAPGVTLGRRDRFLAAAALVARGYGRKVLEDLVTSMGQSDVGREAFLAGAADPSSKEQYFQNYLGLDVPEQWTIDSLGNFHWPGQDEATLPYLRRALERVEWVKANRRVFFMPAWVDAFINGHSSQQALDVVQRFLADNQGLSADIRRKILQSMDSLKRAVAIRSRWK